MRVRQMLPVVVLAALLVPSLAAAQGGTREAGWDFGVDAVYQFSKSVNFEGGSRLNLEDDLGAALTIGYRFNSQLELQFGLDWNNVDYKGTLQSASFPGLNASVNGDMETFSPRVNAVWNFRDAPITPYVTGGIGWAFIDTNIPTGQVQVGCWWDPWWGQICTPYQPTKSVDSFTYQLGAGVRWDFGEYATARFSYDKVWVDLNKASSTPGLDQLKLGFAWRY
jgi:opacity protein-like surface antigen